MTYSRNALTCRDCGACLADCSPLRNGLMAAGGRHVEPGSLGCEACGHCYSICPHGEISVADGAAAGPTSALPVPTDGLLALLSARRSERAFADREPTPEAIATLMAAAGQTPSGGNRHATECLLLVRNERRRRLAERIAVFYRRLGRIVSNPVTRTIVSILLGGPSSAFLRHPDYRARFLSLIRGIERSDDPLFYGAPLVMLFHTSSTIPTPEEDAVLAAYNVALVAQTMGLGSCFVSMAQKAIRSSRAVRKASGIPAANRVLAVLVVGYPVHRRVRSVVRRALPMTRAA